MQQLPFDPVALIEQAKRDAWPLAWQIVSQAPCSLWVMLALILLMAAAMKHKRKRRRED